MEKNLPANAEDCSDAGLIPGWGRSPGGGNGNPLQYSCLENSMDRGAWWTVVPGVTKSQTQLSVHMHVCVHTHTHTHTHTHRAGILPALQGLFKLHPHSLTCCTWFCLKEMSKISWFLKNYSWFHFLHYFFLNPWFSLSSQSLVQV